MSYNFFDEEKKLIIKKRFYTIAGWILFISAFSFSLVIGEVRIDKFIQGIPDFFNYIKEMVPSIHFKTFFYDMGEWYWGIKKWIVLLLDTIMIGFLGTLIGAFFGILFSFLASSNLMKNKIIFQLARRCLEISRSVPEIVYALMFVFAFGLGPFPGVLAISIHTAGSLGKLFSEVNENADYKPCEGIIGSGGNWLQMIRFGIIPQVLPNYLSYMLLRFEINIRAASIIGFVGAGGIGQELMLVIRQFIYTDISAIVIMIIIIVSIIDLVCEKYRHTIIGNQRHA
jgi:phosphonate transport system permease protein